MPKVLRHIDFCLQVVEPEPVDDDVFELSDDFQPFLQDYPLYTDNTANGNLLYMSLAFLLFAIWCIIFSNSIHFLHYILVLQVKCRVNTNCQC